MRMDSEKSLKARKMTSTRNRMHVKTILTELSSSLQQQTSVIRKDSCIIALVNESTGKEHYHPTTVKKFGILLKQISQKDEKDCFIDKQSLKSLAANLVTRYQSIFKDVSVLHVIIAWPTINTLGMTLIVPSKRHDRSRFTTRLKNLKDSSPRFIKKLKRCLQDPLNAKNWDDLHDITDELDDIAGRILKLRDKLITYLEQSRESVDLDERQKFIKYLTLQLIIGRHLQDLGLLKKREETSLLNDPISGQLKSQSLNYHEAIHELIEQIHDDFDGMFTLNESLLTQMTQLSLPNSFYHRDEMKFTLKATRCNKASLSRSSNHVGCLDLLQDIDWMDFKGDFYLLGTLLEQFLQADERKKTGTYYTPPRIAEYIVITTIDAFLLEKINTRFNTMFTSLPDVLATGTNDMLRFIQEVARNIKILDPTMGTGHFLEAACNHLFNLHCHLMEKLENANEMETSPRKVNECSNLLKGSSGTIRSKLMILKHIIQENLHGIDTNPEAVKLSQIRLLLKITALAIEREKQHDAALLKDFISSLHFNLKVGNALIGVHSLDPFKPDQDHPRPEWRTERETEVMNIIQPLKRLQVDVLSPHFITSEELEILKHENTHDLRQCLLIWTNILKRLQFHLKTRTSHPTEENTHYQQLLESYLNIKSRLNQALTRLLELVTGFNGLQSLKPFHWLIEFPEIFFPSNDDNNHPHAGFDIILGNPPYIRQEKIDSLANINGYRSLLAKLFSPSDKKYDYSLYFILRSLQLLNHDGWNSFIITDKWLRTIYGKPLRNVLKHQHSLKLVVDVSQLNLFPNARVNCLIYVLKKASPTNDHHFLHERHQFRSLLIPCRKHSVKQTLLPETRPWTFLPKDLLQLAEWIFSIGTPLKNLRVKIYYGIKTGYNKAFLISTQLRNTLVKKNPKNANIIAPIIMGRCIDRYQVRWNHQWIILSTNGLDLSKTHPEIFQYLKQFERPLKKRTDQGKYWYNLRPCRYYQEFKKPKIMWKEITTRPSFHHDVTGLLVDATAFIMTGMDATKSLTAVLNSSISWFAIQQVGTTLAPGTSRYKREYTFDLPICLPPKSESLGFEVLVDAIQFLKAFQPSTSPEVQQHAKKLEDLLDVLVFELYFNEKLQSRSNIDHMASLRQQVTDICKKIRLTTDQWFKEYWNYQCNEGMTRHWKQSTLLKPLTEHNLKEIRRLQSLLDDDSEIQRTYEMLLRNEWYLNIRRLLMRNRN